MPISNHAQRPAFQKGIPTNQGEKAQGFGYAV